MRTPIERFIRRCDKCGKHKSMKGGASQPGKGFKCRECK